MARYLLRLSTREYLALLAGALALAIAATAIAARPPSASPPAPVRALASVPPAATATPEPTLAATATPAAHAPKRSVAPAAPPAVASGVAIPKDAVAVYRAAATAGQPVSRVREGIPLPVTGRRGRFLEIQTPCQYPGFVDAQQVELLERRAAAAASRSFGSATFVLDPGHGGAAGARGPTGLTESEVNLDIVRRLEGLLAVPHDVDWATGQIRDGSAYARPRVLVTRDGDYAAGLAYRTSIANALGADALLSVHNNAEPDGPSDRPGTETYYQMRSEQSKRLAGLAYEEIVRVLQTFEGVSWVGERDAGAKYRPNEEGGDYYGILRRSTVPAVLVEATFISNAQEEALLRTPEARQAIAGALYRALVRYVTTDDSGSGFVEPYPRKGGPSGALGAGCLDPA